MVRSLILMGSGSFVAVLFIMAVRAAKMKRWGHLGLDIAIAGSTALVMEAVFRVDVLPFSWRTWTYAALMCLGFISGLYIMIRREY